MGKSLEALALRRKCAEHGGQALENEELKKLEDALPRLKRAIWKKRRGFTRRRQEWDATASTHKSLWT